MASGPTVSVDMLSRYKAAMVLSGVGDAMGYKSGHWEFNFVGTDIHKEVKALGGVCKLHVKLPAFPVSDDTVLHLATARALLSGKPIGDKLYLEFAAEYRKGRLDMKGRAPGNTTTSAISRFNLAKPDGYIIPFNKRGGGCGAAMRAMCIGLRYPRPDQLQDLIMVSVESGRMTHNCPTGYLGSFAAALFTSYAIQGVPVISWGRRLVAELPKVLDYVRSVGRDVKENEEAWPYFTDKWTSYLHERGIDGDGVTNARFPDKYDVVERDAFYKSLSFRGWGGSSGHDAPMIAYDALLGCEWSWEKLCLAGMLHGGDNDSTGVMAGCWWGAICGMDQVPECNFKNLEYRSQLEELGEKLYHVAEEERKITESKTS
ncbi:protein ADP-ribosylarginine hydrolase-like [Lytechinus variegatus]|uniref:protein ADP-ribosylarginine hydrolase-like n=1 Tax=Lytechinus variegatus TaxID=7654 RepID=UPI001BB1F7F7|nr:protein ADP-ribosylarginine hydrolase-like [Lytechinus variegatus]XP_041480041.1 protein ADP-ribosylarginine hydrolase-like [Lytechinus variegatus]XP_041480042.1 protein ADP-ribosylarginine hydrolase-like [Lytechinus variegatus]